MTQHEEILGYLRQLGSLGLNSFEYRHKWIQLPVRIKELKQAGYTIVVRKNKNRSVNYILLKEPRQEKKPEVEQKIYDFSTGYAVLVRRRQTSLF